jgi:hypothetical protein
MAFLPPCQKKQGFSLGRQRSEITLARSYTGNNERLSFQDERLSFQIVR